MLFLKKRKSHTSLRVIPQGETSWLGPVNCLSVHLSDSNKSVNICIGKHCHSLWLENIYWNRLLYHYNWKNFWLAYITFFIFALYFVKVYIHYWAGWSLKAIGRYFSFFFFFCFLESETLFSLWNKCSESICINILQMCLLKKINLQEESKQIREPHLFPGWLDKIPLKCEI